MNKNYNTLEYYNQNAKQYYDQTIKGNFQENYERFQRQIPKNAYILDFGCGSGRDSKHFIEKGYQVKAIDGSSKMCELASKYLNQEVECLKFEELKDINTYDAIWACSSILHVEKEELPEIICKMLKALKKNGIIYTSFKKGTGYQIKEGKYYHYLEKEEMENILSKIDNNVRIIEYFEKLPSKKRNAKDTIWINFIIKKIG